MAAFTTSFLPAARNFTTSFAGVAIRRQERNIEPSTPQRTTTVAQAPNPFTKQLNRTTEVKVDGAKSAMAGPAENLRFVLQREKVDLYAFKGKLLNCGGYGNCGTCIVDITEGASNCNARTPAEEKLLRNKPESWRLACQCVVNGPIAIATKPQAKK
eukprot:tig00020830_g14419.t1